MRGLWECRLEDIGQYDRVKVECACGHLQLLGADYFKAGKLPGYQRIVELERRMRCRECDERGKVMVSIKWAG